MSNEEVTGGSYPRQRTTWLRSGKTYGKSGFVLPAGALSGPLELPSDVELSGSFPDRISYADRAEEFQKRALQEFRGEGMISLSREATVQELNELDKALAGLNKVEEEEQARERQREADFRATQARWDRSEARWEQLHPGGPLVNLDQIKIKVEPTSQPEELIFEGSRYRWTGDNRYTLVTEPTPASPDEAQVAAARASRRPAGPTPSQPIKVSPPKAIEGPA
jgi:hypothetical protein